MKLALATILLIGCGVTSNQASEGAKASCSLLEAFADNNVIDSICATAPELAAIAADIIAKRTANADGGIDGGIGKKLDKCRALSTTQVCATESEILAGIKVTKAARK